MGVIQTELRRDEAARGVSWSERCGRSQLHPGDVQPGSAARGIRRSRSAMQLLPEILEIDPGLLQRAHPHRPAQPIGSPEIRSSGNYAGRCAARTSMPSLARASTSRSARCWTIAVTTMRHSLTTSSATDKSRAPASLRPVGRGIAHTRIIQRLSADWLAPGSRYPIGPSSSSPACSAPDRHCSSSCWPLIQALPPAARSAILAGGRPRDRHFRLYCGARCRWLAATGHRLRRLPRPDVSGRRSSRTSDRTPSPGSA